MKKENWRNRLLAAIEEDGRSYRAISQRAGLGENFVNQLRRIPKASPIDKILKLISVLNVSIIYIFTGVEVSKQDEDLFILLAAVPEEAKEALLKALQVLLQKD